MQPFEALASVKNECNPFCNPSFRVNPYHHYKSYHLQKHLKQALRTSVAKPCFLVGWFFFEANKSNNNRNNNPKPPNPPKPPQNQPQHIMLLSFRVSLLMWPGLPAESWSGNYRDQKTNEFGGNKKVANFGRELEIHFYFREIYLDLPVWVPNLGANLPFP